MIKGFGWNVIGVVALFGLLGGCLPGQAEKFFAPTFYDVKQIATEQGKRLDAHDKNITGQHTLQNPELADEFAALRGNFTKSSKEIDERIKKLESSLGPILEEGLKGVLALAKLAGYDLPGMFNNVDKKVDKKSDAQKAALAALGTQVGELTKDLLALRESVKQGLDSANDKSDDGADRIRELLTNLNQDTRDKFAVADKETIAALNAVKDNRENFDQELQRRFDLTDAQMKDLEGLSMAEIMALIAAAGAGIAGGRTGRSRTQPTVDDHERRLARVETGGGGGGGGGAGTQPAGGSGGAASRPSG